MLRTAITENGIVQGIEAADPRITAFKGIPFAAPPVGDNRWRAPQPCHNWERVLQAYRFGPIAMQDTPGIGDNIYIREWHVDPDIAMDEDCLQLNIWTSAKSVDEKQPVMVWFYGGAFQWGYPAEMEFDGERIARRGVVVVTVNYRINVFGFMAHPELTEQDPEAPANFGLLDQQAALKWVQRNIHAFGGDPDNVTITGQSAGGGSVLSQLTCPDNDGLFHKAIIQSAMITSPYKGHSLLFRQARNLSEAEQNGVKFLDFLGVKSLEEARKLDALYIRDMYAKYAVNNDRFGPIVDGKFSIGNSLALIMEGKHIKVPMMSGNTTNEFPSFIHADSDDEFIAKVKEMFGDHGDEFLKLEEAWKKDSNNNYAAVSGIECSVKSVFLQQEKNQNPHKHYYYRFDADIPGWDNPGAFHSVDLWFFFETLAKCWRPFKGKHYDLARQMCNYYCNFIKSGDPNGKDADGTDLPYWGPYTSKTPHDMVFTTEGAYLEQDEETDFMKFLIERNTEEIMGLE